MREFPNLFLTGRMMRVAAILIWLPVADRGNANVSLKEFYAV